MTNDSWAKDLVEEVVLDGCCLPREARQLYPRLGLPCLLNLPLDYAMPRCAPGASGGPGAPPRGRWRTKRQETTPL